MKRLLFITFLLITQIAYAGNIGGQNIGSQVSFINIPEISGNTVTGNDVYATNLYINGVTANSTFLTLAAPNQTVTQVPDFPNGLKYNGVLLFAVSNQTYYLDPAGSDTTGDGTIGNPWLTITKALSVMPKNLGGTQQTILLAAGTYTVTPISVGGFLNGDISISGVGAATILDVPTDNNLFNIFGCSAYIGIDSMAIRLHNNNNIVFQVTSCSYVELSSIAFGDTANTGTYGITGNSSTLILSSLSDMDASKVETGLGLTNCVVYGSTSTVAFADTLWDVASSFYYFLDTDTDGQVIDQTLTLKSGSITDSTGAISFGNENLSTTGTIGGGAITGTSLIQSTPAFISGEKFSKSFIITNPTATADNSVWRAPVALTITAVHLLCKGNVVVGHLTEQDANGLNDAGVDGATDITGVAATNVNDDGALSNSSIDANDYIGWRTTSVTGSPTSCTVTFEGYFN